MDLSILCISILFLCNSGFISSLNYAYNFSQINPMIPFTFEILHVITQSPDKTLNFPNTGKDIKPAMKNRFEIKLQAKIGFILS